MLMAPLLSSRPTLPGLWPQTEGHFLSNLLGCSHRFCVCHVVPGSLESSREGPLLSVTSVLLVMELSHHRMLKLEGILEICWPISLLWLQEKESCLRSHSALMAEPESALKHSPALFPLCQAERNVFGSWDSSRGLLPLSSYFVMLSNLNPMSPECEWLWECGSRVVSHKLRGNKQRGNARPSMSWRGLLQRSPQTQWSFVPAPT